MTDSRQSPGPSAARLVLFSGPPGVGKSSLSYALSRRTGWAVVAKDGIDRTAETCAGSLWQPIWAYHLMLGIADLNLRNGVSLILDAVFPKQAFRLQAMEIAAQHNARFLAIVCQCSDRRLWRSRVEQRPEVVPGWTPANWEEAQRVATYYEEWHGPHLSLDAAGAFDENLARVLRYVQAP